jgi:hypothetical protein
MICPTGTGKLSTTRLRGAEMVRYSCRMTTRRDPLYAGSRYPPELIGYAAWLYFRFPLMFDPEIRPQEIRPQEIRAKRQRARSAWLHVLDPAVRHAHDLGGAERACRGG